MRVYVAVALVLLAALSGCADKKDDGKGADADTPLADTAASLPTLLLNITIGNQTFNFTSAKAASQPGHGGHNGSASPTTTSSANATTGNTTGNATGNATGNSTMPSGLAPLNVTFELSAQGLEIVTAVRWTFDFGRAGGNATGNSTGNATDNSTAANGTALPATLNHTYVAVGDYNVTFVLRVGNGTAQALRATIHVGNGTGNVSVTPALPAVTHFEFGESLGCTADTPAGNTCIEWDNGPPGSDIDGHWIPLDASYWGLLVTSTITQGGPVTVPVVGADLLNDSDCVFTDGGQAILGEGNNGGNPCTGLVPEGSAWLFIYPYGSGALDMTVDFGVAPPAEA